MNNKIKDILSQGLIIALTAMLFVSCSSDPDSEPNPGGGSSGPDGTQNAEFAPDYVAGKEFKFYGIKDGEYDLKYRVVAATDPMKAKIYVEPTEYTVISAPSFYYDKTDKNTADVSCVFHYDLLGIIGFAQIFDYQLELTFKSPNYGTYEGKLTHYESANDWITVKGAFVYDSDKTIEQLAKEAEDDNDSNNQTLNWQHLTSTTWLSKQSNYDLYMCFDDKGKYKRAIVISGKEPISMSGTYQIDKAKKQISLSSIGDYKVESLTQSELKIVSVSSENTNSSTVTETYKSTDKDFPDTPKITISEPTIEDITDTSVTVKGSINVNGASIQERGVCYSTSENPTINGKVKRADTNTINVSLTNLEKGTKYYVRLYAKVDGAVSYSSQCSFTTTGVATSGIEITASKIGMYQLFVDVKIPSTRQKKYGLCYGTAPNPKISDNSTQEANYTTTEWMLDELTPGQTYYVRAYHIEDSKVIYYEDSEVAISTLGQNALTSTISIPSIYWGSTEMWSNITYFTIYVRYNVPEADYNAKIQWSGLNTGIQYSATKYISGGEGGFYWDKFTTGSSSSSPGYMDGGSYPVLTLTSIETGVVYFVVYSLIMDPKKKTVDWVVDSDGYYASGWL